MFFSWIRFTTIMALVVSNVLSIPVDNGVEGEPEILCGESSIGVRIKTRNPFLGHVYVKGRFSEKDCKAGGESEAAAFARLILPFGSCNVRRSRSVNPKGMYADVTVVISFHPQFVTKVDRAYTVQCFYMELDKSVSAELEVSMLTTVFQTQNVQMPVCRYEVLAGGPTGAPVKYAKVGDAVYHKWTCDTETSKPDSPYAPSSTNAVDMFCMTVHSCFVNDGAGEQIPLLEPITGCAQDKYLLNNLEYPTDLMAGRESHVFKYADKSSLYFNCQITLTVKESNSKCMRPNCPDPTRGKRSASNHTKTDEFIAQSDNGRSQSSQLDLAHDEMNRDGRTAVVDVNSDFITILDLDAAAKSDLPSNARSPLFAIHQVGSNDKSICLSIHGFTTFVALSALLLLTSMMITVCMYRRAQKRYRRS